MEDIDVSNLKPIQQQAAQLLASGKCITDVAFELGYNRSSIHLWLREDDNFLAYLNSLKVEQIEAARQSLRAATSHAIQTVVDLATSSSSDATKLAAAVKILEMSGVLGGASHFETDASKLAAMRKLGDFEII